MAGRLEGRRALVTGASRGIGRAIAERFAEEGARLCLAATSEAKLAETRAAVMARGGDPVLVAGDVSERGDVERIVGACVDGLGGLDVLVNNAGVYAAARFVDYTPETFDRVMKVNAYGVFHAMQVALKRMTAEGGGKIVNIASTAGRHESMNQAAYNASKHAVVGMTRCAALEHAADGITVNAICPGFVETDMLDNFSTHAEIMGIGVDQLMEGLKGRVPMRRFLQPREIAELAVYLAAPESDGMTGQCIVISGGMRMD
jgi:NAD(P)-dependent dehydrogenase (short-subunit alcohol dehydrogenase family)